MTEAQKLHLKIITSINEVAENEWNALISNPHQADESIHQAAESDYQQREPNPFVLHQFLSSLEESGSASARTGWLGQHLILQNDAGKLVGALPCYLKNHSQGEYVFDHGWAEAFDRAGGNYYPKLQASIPFTPATGPRFLVHKNAQSKEHISVLAEGLKQLAKLRGASSAHITFMPEDDWKLVGEQDYLLRKDQQFHWHNNGYSDFAEFLDGLSSRKRKNIRKERDTALGGGQISIECLSGSDLTESVWDDFFSFYMDTGSRKWGRPYLTRKFYSLIGERMADKILLVMAKRAGKYIAGAINFIGDNRLYGRHWGCIEDHPFLHFEVCYYQAIEYAIAHRLAYVEAGAQGVHKLARGYVPQTTFSAHYIVHPGFREAIADYLQHERQQVELENEALNAHTPFRKA